MQCRTVSNLELNGLLHTVSVRGGQRGKLYSRSGIVIGYNLSVLKGRKDISAKRAVSQQQWMGYDYNRAIYQNLKFQSSHYILEVSS